MGLLDWLRGEVPVLPRRKNYRVNLEYQPDPLKDIGDLGIDYFWCKCEELLPDDWCFGLFASPDGYRPGRLLYQARAALISDDDALASLPHITTEWRTTPLRAIENLYYALGRDML
jgi:hypothetical protein